MEQMCVYVVNFGKYNEGELVGTWFTPPIDFGKVKERIGLGDDYEEYTIHDYELPFEIDEYTSIEEINRSCGLAEELKGTPIGEVASEIQHVFSNSFEEMVKHVNDIVYYPGCSDIEDLAYQMVNERYSRNTPENFVRRFSYSSSVRGLEIGGNYLATNRDILEYPV